MIALAGPVLFVLAFGGLPSAPLAQAPVPSETHGMAGEPDTARAGSVGKEIVILDQPVRVTAVLKESEPADWHYAFVIFVEHHATRFTLSTDLVMQRSDKLVDATNVLRRTIGWKDHFLFVRTDCGTGNAWQCTSESIFALRGDQLVGLGTLLGAERRLATSWDGRFFHGIYADLEGNDLTSHAGAPWFEVLYRERGGRLVPDVDSTWSANAGPFATWDSTAVATSAPAGPEGGWETVVAPRFSRAALAKYCRRDRELAAVLAESRRVLPQRLFEAFTSELARVEPGVLPRTSAPPVPDPH